METGAITQYVDVAQVVLYAFWGFFFGLVYYLSREGHREGYPMENGRIGGGGPKITGWPMPDTKTYKLHDGRVIQTPDPNRPDGSYSSQPTHGWNGAPIEPVGNPLTAGVGPGAWAARADIPDMDEHHQPKIVPLRVAAEHGVVAQDTDPRGLPVIGADGEEAGRVRDLWIDRMEMMFRYLEVTLPSGAHVLLPVNFARVRKQQVEVQALLASQFAFVPATRHPEQVTMLEEEKIVAVYGAGTLYATPQRQEPML